VKVRLQRLEQRVQAQRLAARALEAAELACAPAARFLEIGRCASLPPFC